ncbi:hypothetical protein ABZ371_24910 [Streptomyces sp. NPDC005899]|uniref:hypothetical protein n=1 Tax=Streptomyces sp. NPDC005899 TaxID=3155716 RepID=UPI0033DAF7EC
MNTTLLDLTTGHATGMCPTCGGNFETCRCTGAVPPVPHAERDETDSAFHQLVGRLVTDGDTRAESVGRQARRTLAEMAPGYERQPVLLLTRPLTFRSANDACPLCGYWTCRCGAVAPAPQSTGQVQCDTCGTWFGYAGWTCSACQQLRAVEPTPHERDGRTEPAPAPARPHSAVPERHQP